MRSSWQHCELQQNSWSSVFPVLGKLPGQKPISYVQATQCSFWTFVPILSLLKLLTFFLPFPQSHFGVQLGHMTFSVLPTHKHAFISYLSKLFLLIFHQLCPTRDGLKKKSLSSTMSRSRTPH